MITANLVGTGPWAEKIFRNIHTNTIRIANVVNRSGIFPDWVPQDLRSKREDLDPGTPLIIAAGPAANVEFLDDPRFVDTPMFIEKPAVLDVDSTLRYRSRKALTTINYVTLHDINYAFARRAVCGAKGARITRRNLGSGPKRAFSALWDYGPHEMSIFCGLGLRYPTEVHAHAFKNDGGSVYDVTIRTVGGDRFNTIFGNISVGRQNTMSILTDSGWTDLDFQTGHCSSNGSILASARPGGALRESLAKFSRDSSGPPPDDTLTGWKMTELVTRILAEVEYQTR